MSLVANLMTATVHDSTDVGGRFDLHGRSILFQVEVAAGDLLVVDACK
jgi:hypothetical protein